MDLPRDEKIQEYSSYKIKLKTLKKARRYELFKKYPGLDSSSDASKDKMSELCR